MKIPTFSKNEDPVLRMVDRMVEWFILIMFGCITLLVCCSCSITRTVPVETIKEVARTDTLFIHDVQYDSIYVSQNLFTDRSKDTILIYQHDAEYRYKMIRDTVERVKLEVIRDSIPYEVRIETIKEVPRKRSWFDLLCRYSLFLLLGGLLIFLFKTIRQNH